MPLNPSWRQATSSSKRFGLSFISIQPPIDTTSFPLLSTSSPSIHIKDGCISTAIVDRLDKVRRTGTEDSCSNPGEAQWHRPILEIRFGRCCLLFCHPWRSYTSGCVSNASNLVVTKADAMATSVKTRIQLDPVTYNKGMIGGFRQVIANEGAGALLTGFGPTAAGYFLQGAFKFGGYELFKQQCINYLGYETASNNRTSVYLASSALAEFFADIALCPLEATRIRLVSQPTFATGLLSGFGKIASQEGLGAFYSGFGPILFKQ